MAEKRLSRESLLKELKAYCPSEFEKHDILQNFIKFVENNEDCFQRSNLAGHITASALVINQNFNKILLTHHKKLNKWLQLGGHADGDDNVRRVAMKEAQEESGLKEIQFFSNEIIDIDIHEIPKFQDVPGHFHYDVRFLLIANDSQPLIISEESKDLAWFDLNEKNSKFNPSLQRLCAHAINFCKERV